MLPDARLYATWDYEVKDFRAPIASHGHGAKFRGRLGSIAGAGGTSSSGTITLGPGGRSGRAGSKIPER